jgi:hypothetical protein
MQPELLQNPPGMQAVSSVQLVRQAPPEQRYPLQLVATLATQVPPPLQMWLAITAEFVLSQPGVALQTVLAGHRAQLPEPLQEPMLPQELCGWAVHSVRGSVPLPASVQVPVLFAQVWHFAEQSVAQQVLSKQ